MRLIPRWFLGCLVVTLAAAQCRGEDRAEDKNWMAWQFFDLEDGSKLRFELTRRPLPEDDKLRYDPVVSSLVRYLSDSQKEVLWEEQFSYIGPNEGVQNLSSYFFEITAARSFDGVYCVLYGDCVSPSQQYLRVDTNSSPHGSLSFQRIEVGRSTYGKAKAEVTITTKNDLLFKFGSASARFSISDDGHVTMDGVDYAAIPTINGKRMGEDLDAAKRVWDPVNSKKDAQDGGSKGGGITNRIASSIRGAFTVGGNGWVLPCLVALGLALVVLWARMRKQAKRAAKQTDQRGTRDKSGE